MKQRYYFIDNLRWVTVALVLIYHVFYNFNAQGVFGGIGGFAEEQWQDVLFNDFEETVFAKYPELAAIKKSLYDSGAVYACMSGSGSALFALYEK